MTHPESNGHVTDDDAWPWKVKIVTPIHLEANISETAGDRDLVTMEHLQCELKKIPLRLSEFFSISHKRLKIFNRFFTHLLHFFMYPRLEIFVQLSPTLTKLCHIKRDFLVYIICAKCPERAKTRAFRRLCKSLIALLIFICGKSRYNKHFYNVNKRVGYEMTSIVTSFAQ